MTFAFGSVSVRIVRPMRVVAFVPVLAAASIQFDGWPTTATALTLFASASVRSETSAIAHSENEVILLKPT